MKIYKYGYEEDYTDKDKSKENGGLIVNDMYLWNYPSRGPEKTRIFYYDKEVKVEWILD